MNCLTDLGAGSFQLTSPQPELITDCVYLLVEPSELAPEWYSLTAEQGGQIATSMSVLLAIGFIFRWIIRALKSDPVTDD